MVSRGRRTVYRIWTLEHTNKVFWAFLLVETLRVQRVAKILIGEVVTHDRGGKPQAIRCLDPVFRDSMRRTRIGRSDGGRGGAGNGRTGRSRKSRNEVIGRIREGRGSGGHRWKSSSFIGVRERLGVDRRRTVVGGLGYTGLVVGLAET